MRTLDPTPIHAELLSALLSGTVDAPEAGGAAYAWGDNAVPPAEDAVEPTLPYGILYDTPGTIPVWDVTGDQADAALTQQVTCVGKTPDSAKTLAGRARTTLCALSGTKVGSVTIVRIESAGHPPVGRVGSLFQTSESFTVFLSS